MTVGRRVKRLFRRLFRMDRALQPEAPRHLFYDPVFVAGSFRPGERVDPFAATIEEPY